MPILRNMLLRTIAGVNRYCQLPIELFTGTGNNPRPRLRVDPGQTGFFEGREFRQFYELSIPEGQSRWLRVESPVDFILWELQLSLATGDLRYEPRVGGTESGTFTELRPSIPKNNMTERPQPVYESVVTVQTGGSHSGGTLIDLIILNTADVSNFQQSVGSGMSERGLAPGVYYLKFQNTGTGTCTGVFSASWEERAPASIGEF